MNFSFELPKKYREEEILTFHSRDPECMAEKVEAGHLQKGFVLRGEPIALDIRWRKGNVTGQVVAPTTRDDLLPELVEIARRLLGLTIDPASFEISMARDPLLGPLIAQKPGLRIPQTSTTFEALTWAIIGQQINLRFAVQLRRTLIQLAGCKHPCGLWCYPDAEGVAALTADELGQRKFSRAKAETILRVADMVRGGELPLEMMANESTSSIANRLLSIKGIGPWTVNYVLLRGYAAPDCSLHGDAGIKAALHKLLGQTEKPTPQKIETILANYSPHRSLAAAHLWQPFNERPRRELKSS